MPPARDVRVFRNDARRRRAENEERFFDCVDTSPTEIALGVTVVPARMSTPSCTINSCACRFATSGAMPVSSRRTITTFRPATVSPYVF